MSVLYACIHLSFTSISVTIHLMPYMHIACVLAQLDLRISQVRHGSHAQHHAHRHHCLARQWRRGLSKDSWKRLYGKYLYLYPSISFLHPSIYPLSLSGTHEHVRAHARTRVHTHTHTRCATRLLTWPRRPGSRRRWESYRAPVCVQRQPKDLLSTSLTPSLAR